MQVYLPPGPNDMVINLFAQGLTESFYYNANKMAGPIMGFFVLEVGSEIYLPPSF